MNKHLKPLLRGLMPRAIRPHRILRGPLRGQRIVTSWHDYPAAILGYTESPLLDWFARNVASGETWLDVGAHYGYTSIALSRLVGEGGRTFAFEPVSSTAGYLAQTRMLNHLPQLKVLPIALGAPEQLELRQLAQVRGMADSTLKSRQWVDTFLLARFDWLWPRICGPQDRIHGIKIDVQGMEIEVLKGMPNLLKLYGPKLAIEFHQGVVREQALDLIEAAGYSRSGVPIEPVQGEIAPQYVDDRSYAFQKLRTS